MIGNSVCYGCDERHLRCHTSCEKYLKEEKNNKRLRAIRKKVNSETNSYMFAKRICIALAEKKKGRRN